MTVILLILLLTIIQITLSDVLVYNNANKNVENYDDQPASFGPSFPTKGIKGFITLTNPKNACTRIAPPPPISIPDYYWIALIPRTNLDTMCDFDLKVLNAQNANFSAVIIYNYEDSLVPMNPHGKDIQIPSTLITFSDGLSLISNYVYNKSSTNSTPAFYVKITDEQFFNFAAYIIPFASVIGISFLGFIGFMLVKCYLHRRRTRRHRLPRSALKQLKVKKFVKGDRWEVCAICLDDYVDGAKLRILPCDHAYHMKCIDPWLLNSRRQCPVCKRYVFPNQDNSDEEENNSQAQTERTPLIQPTIENLATVLSRNRPIDRRIINPSGSGVSNTTFAINESSDTDDDLLSPPQTTTNNITTNALVFDRPSYNSQRYSRTQLPRVALRQSSIEENENQDTTATTYGSVHDSPSTSFTTPRATNYFVNSVDGITDNMNITARSIIEDISDVDTDDNDERMHSVLTDVEINPSYIPDEEAANVLHKNV